MNGALRRAVGVAATAGCLAVGVVATADAGSTSGRAADLAAARHQWVGAQLLSGGAEQAVPLIPVVADLEQAIAAGAHRTTYTRAINTIVKFGELPDAMMTPAQSKQFTADITAISSFLGFKKSPWTTGCVSHGAEARAAAQAWSEEPQGTNKGILKSHLRAAAADLTRGLRIDAGDRSCYPAAIEDLDNLQTATAAEIAATPNAHGGSFKDPGAVQVAWADILWLDDWFDFTGHDAGVLTSSS